MKLGVSQSLYSAMRRTSFSFLGPCLCVVLGRTEDTATNIFLVWGGAREPPKWVPGWCWRGWGGGLVLKVFLPGRVLQRFVEQITDEDGVVLAVVDVPVICSDKFLQFLFLDVEVPQLQFIAGHSLLCNRDGYAVFSCGGSGGDEGAFRVFSAFFALLRVVWS